MGLKESKKFAIGSIHENGGGKFEILERWFDEETDTIMLKYKYENGKIETNKEANVNASEWKWRKVRGMAGSSILPNTPRESDTQLEEYFEGLYVRLAELSTENSTIMKQIRDSQAEHTKMLVELLSVIKVQQQQIDQLVKENNIIAKLLDKI